MKFLLPATAIVLALTSALAMASTRTVTTSYMVNGKPVTAQQALEAALKDIPVQACKPVQAIVSRGGNSVRLGTPKLAKSL